MGTIDTFAIETTVEYLVGVHVVFSSISGKQFALISGLLASIIVIDSCSGEEGGDPCGPPIVSAGRDQEPTVGQLVGLRGDVRLPPEASEVCLTEKELLTFEWEQTEGPDVEIMNALALEASFVPAEVGVYKFSFVATYPVTELNKNPMISTPDVVTITVR